MKPDHEEETHLIPQDLLMKNDKPKENDYTELLKNALWEMIGTYLFISTIYFTKGDVTKFAFGFWVILIIFGKMSGAHLNPAITSAFFIYNIKNFSFEIVKLVTYWLAQFVGALIGALISSHFFLENVYVDVPTHKPLFDIVYSEFFFTGSFAFVILFVCSAYTKPTDCSPFGCAVIISWFYMIVNAGSTISGAAYNPAILSVLNILAKKENPQAVNYLISMISAEILGAAFFAFVFKYLYEEFYRARYSKH